MLKPSDSPVKLFNTRYGLMAAPGGGDLISRSLEIYGEWAETEILAFKRFIKPGDIVIDVGACFGTHTLAMADAVCPGGRVIAIDASPANFAFLKRNAVESPHSASIELINAAASSASGDRFRIVGSSDNFGASRAERASAGEVDAMAIDNLGLTRLSFMKLDIEGMEAEALKGAARTISNARPTIFFEVNSVHNALSVLDVLREARYEFLGIALPAYNPENFCSNPVNMFGSSSECGIFAIPSESSEMVLPKLSDFDPLRISDADDVAALLIRKPQYIAERNLKVIPKVQLEEIRTSYQSEVRQLSELNSSYSKKLQDQAGLIDKLKDTIHGLENELEDIRKQLSDTTIEMQRLNFLLSQAKLVGRYAPRIPLSTMFRGRDEYRSALHIIKDAEIIGPLPDQSVQAQPDQAEEATDVAQKDERIRYEISVVAAAFDRWFYVGANPHVLATGMTPEEHYCRVGWRKGLDPSKAFSTNFYLASNPDVAAARINPFWHYLVAGKDEGRIPRDPSVIKETSGNWMASAVRALRGLQSSRNTPIDTERIEELLQTACTKGGNKLVVSVGHDDYRNIPGGVQVCIQQEEKAATAKGIAYLNIHPVEPLPKLSGLRDSPGPRVHLLLAGQDIGTASMDQLISVIRRLHGDANSVEVVVHHLLGHSPEKVGELASAAGGNRLWLWLHDFFALCPSYSLQRNDTSFCGAPPPTSNACSLCVYGEERLSHLSRMQTLFDSLKVIAIAPSKVMADSWTARSDFTPAEIMIHPHLTLTWSDTTPNPDSDERNARHFKIGFAGTRVSHKGWPVFEDLANAGKKEGWAMRFHYLGVTDPKTDAIESVHVHVTQEDPDAMISTIRRKEIDVVLHWPSCEETFSLTTYEAIAAGAAVVTHAESGNVAAVVRETGKGLVLNSLEELKAAFADGRIVALAQETRRSRKMRKATALRSNLTLDLID